MEYDDPEEQYAMSLGEVARELGISRARVWQIEKTAIEKLKKRLIKAGITKDLCKDLP